MPSKAAICGTSCAENVPPASGITSTTPTSMLPGVTHPSARLPFFPDVSIAKRSMRFGCQTKKSKAITTEGTEEHVAKLVSSSVGAVYQFQQYASGALRMHEDVAMTAGSDFDLF